MADKAIGELPSIADLYDDSLIPVEQQGVASKMTGRQFADFAREAAAEDVQRAVDAADAAEQSKKDAETAMGEAKDSAAEAAKSAEKAEYYSGKPPIIQGGTWWTWDADKQEYEDTGEAARGNLMFAAFWLDPFTGDLYMYTDDEYTGPRFRLNGNNLEVLINA